MDSKGSSCLASSVSGALLFLGFRASKNDTSLFIYSRSSTIIFVIVYADDIILYSNNTTILQENIQQLSTMFAMKVFGRLHLFLGIEAHFCKDGFLLTQSKYITELLSKFDMLSLNPVPTPLASKRYLLAHDGDFLSTHTLYRQMLGAL